MMDDEDRVWFAAKAKKLSKECFDDTPLLIAAAVTCLDLIVDHLAEISEKIGAISYELEAHRGLHKDDDL